MTILSVQSEDEILLDGTRYRLRSRLTRQLVSVYPGKVVIGDTSRDSRPRTSNPGLLRPARRHRY